MNHLHILNFLTRAANFQNASEILGIGSDAVAISHQDFPLHQNAASHL
jgi:hypothetical protein